MPVADTRTSLPVCGLWTVWNTTLYVPHHVALLLLCELFTSYDNLLLTIMQVCAVVVVVLENVLSHLVVTSIERHGCVVKVQHIRIVVVDKLKHTVLELLLIGGRRLTCTIDPIPLTVYCSAVFPTC